MPSAAVRAAGPVHTPPAAAIAWSTRAATSMNRAPTARHRSAMAVVVAAEPGPVCSQAWIVRWSTSLNVRS
ncbi:hypothetical protein LX15_004334 [Streptoalloteichus tenebrarius]|uniref:Uncharacterized protein n=1 Tax=Streptoalloteichus tenebrarius (strain ATCC 17920 / DSM 40477 / JCM 4838 / CBS 697.72 / NBRC 16177 / NCIMB 11028 / NRRL B-12390 / A12253. 1 / ISP 5477) TaxID=1933 RepID=A0ABT1HZ32_STRSD|nr:hypothetical protein [Streptoalloteichus tenebrarius]